MLRLHRHFSKSAARFYPSGTPLRHLYASLLSDLNFNIFKLDERLGDELKPYDFSISVLQKLRERDTSSSNQALIHNRIIETLTKYEYAVGTIHARELKKIGGHLTVDSFIQIIMNNPGRVQSSFEIFLENYSLVKDTPAALLAVLNKLIQFDPVDIEDGKKELTAVDVGRCFFLLRRIQSLGHADEISNQNWHVLLQACIDNKASTLLPILLEDFSPPIELLESFEELSEYQMYQLFHNRGLELFKDDPSLFLRAFKVLGKNREVHLSPEEKEVEEKISKTITDASDNCKVPQVFTSPLAISTENAFQRYLDIFKNSYAGQVGLIDISRFAIRSNAIYRNDFATALEMLNVSMEADSRHREELRYEMFLAFIYRSIEKSDEQLLKSALTYSPQGASGALSLSVSRALICAFSKFDMEKGLELFNATIQKVDKKEPEDGSLSESALLTKTLILAYLTRRDRDFAHVILDGAARENIFPTPTAMKQVKKLFAAYGDILDQENSDEKLEEMLLNHIKCL